MSSNNFKKDIKNLKGTFAVEGMTISNQTVKDLKRVTEGKTTYVKLVNDIKEKYMQRL